ncbi:MAG: LysM peptidoglycan-binding domain-containing protein [Planctomycetes bacterium]|nr:LysM peptidoglycan-binding domain-containing protein [Planctomycetota bacterium]
MRGGVDSLRAITVLALGSALAFLACDVPPRRAGTALARFGDGGESAAAAPAAGTAIPGARRVRPEPPIPIIDTPLPVHRVRPKETLYSIAARYDTTVEQLLRLNRDISVHELPIGYELKLPGGKPAVRAVRNNAPAPRPVPAPRGAAPKEN